MMRFEQQRLIQSDTTGLGDEHKLHRDRRLSAKTMRFAGEMLSSRDDGASFPAGKTCVPLSERITLGLGGGSQHPTMNALRPTLHLASVTS